MLAWLISLGTAAWFALLARQARRNWLLWGFAGWAFALVVSTIVLGLGQAAIIPMSHGASHWLRIGSVAAALVLVISLGWLFTARLHGQHHAFWKTVKGLLSSRAPAEAQHPGTGKPPAPPAG